MTDSITRQSEPVVPPPGIVWFKTKEGRRYNQYPHSDYDNWVKFHLSEGSKIDEILVDGIQWAVGERVEDAGIEDKWYLISELKWMDNKWHFLAGSSGHYSPITSVSKLPPTPEQGKLNKIDSAGNIVLSDIELDTYEQDQISEQETGKVHPNSKEVLERESGHVSLSEYKALFQENADLGEEICLLNEEVASLKFALVSPINPTPDKGVWTDAKDLADALESVLLYEDWMPVGIETFKAIDKAKKVLNNYRDKNKS